MKFQTKSILCLVPQLCPTLCDPMDCSSPYSSVHGDSPGKNTGVDCHTLLQGIFSTLGSNSGVPHCRQNLYHLSHQGSPRILEWVSACRAPRWPGPGRDGVRLPHFPAGPLLPSACRAGVWPPAPWSLPSAGAVSHIQKHSRFPVGFPINWPLSGGAGLTGILAPLGAAA